MIKELVEYIVKSIVAHPDVVQVSIVKSGPQTSLEIKVSPDDRGRIIGREGQTIKALRTIVDTVTPRGKRVSLDIVT